MTSSTSPGTVESAPPLRPPLSIYVIHHPASEECRELANHLHDWFRLKQDDGDGTEAGLPIWFRSRLDGAGRVSPPIPWDAAQRNAVVVLADDHLVADVAWRAAIEGLLGETVRDPDGLRTRAPVFPVPVDYSAYRLTFLFGTRNRLDAGSPRSAEDAAKEAEAKSPDDAKKLRADRIFGRARVLRRGLTEALIRELRQSEAAVVDETAPEPLQVFLSHAKSDGRTIAESIRDALADYGQLKTWYDANDLPPSYPWAWPMEQAAQEKTAAMISVVTDAYPTRHWCRREVILARTPRSLDVSKWASPDAVRVWTVQPSVAVAHASSRWSRPMAQLAQVPHIGWSGNATDQGRNIEDVVDRLLLESLLITFYRCFAPALAAQHVALQRTERLALLTWVPDPWSLAKVLGELLKQPGGGTWLIAYPGHGLRAAEIDELEDVLEVMHASATSAQPMPDETRREPPMRARLLTQERLSQLADDEIPTGLRVVISGGGEPSDVESAGIGTRHVGDLMVRLARRLLEAGERLFYGGSLSNYNDNLTKTIIDAALGWDARPSRRSSRPTGAKALLDAPLVNYAAWPHDRFITLKQKAELTGICRFETVGAPASGEPWDEKKAEHAKMAADALTAMRRKASEECDIRVAFAGKLTGWTGWMPGLLEEVCCSLEAGQLPLVFGGFGGTSHEIAAFLTTPDAPWPRALTYDAARENAAFRSLSDKAGAELAASKFDAAKATLETYRAKLHGSTRWDFDVDRALVLRLLAVTSPSAVIDGVLRALASVKPRR